MFKKAVSLILSFSLLLTHPVFAQGAAGLDIGKYLNRIPAVKSDSFRPAHLRYVSYDAVSNDFKLLLDQGEAFKGLSPKGTVPDERLQDATQELFNYFLIGLSLPNDKFWVNLRPDAPEQIIDPLLEKTDMGRIMLEADLELKKDTASFTSPKTSEGKEYWDKLYKRAGELFGTENITIPTITRPWIVPGEVIIRESQDSSYIYKANLKVMLEEDYLKSSSNSINSTNSINYSFNDPRLKELNQYSTQLIREFILPKLTLEVNTSKKYAQLRQVFFSLILSRWFKDRFKGKIGQYSQLIDSRNLDNLTSKEVWSKDYYFNQYKKSFQQGEYNLKEQITTPTGQVIRSYVSGGINPLEGISFISHQSNSSLGTYLSDNRMFSDLSFLPKVKDAVVYVRDKFGLMNKFYPNGDDYKQESPHDGYGVTGSVDTEHLDVGSSPLTIEESQKSLEEYKKEIQGFPLKYLKEG